MPQSDPAQRARDLAEAEAARGAKASAALRSAAIDALLGPAVDALGPKHFAVALGLGVDRVDRCYHWLERRNGQRPPAEMLVHACAAGPDEVWAALCALVGRRYSERVSPEPDAEMAREALEELARFGELGAAAVERIMRRQGGGRT